MTFKVAQTSRHGDGTLLASSKVSSTFKHDFSGEVVAGLIGTNFYYLAISYVLD